MYQISSIHHISALVGEPHRHYHFYSQVLGLRLIKRTLNFDDPTTYHLYYSSKEFNPDFIFTTFPSTTGEQGRLGGGQVGRIAFRIPRGSLSYWKERLNDHRVRVATSQLFGQTTLEFSDPDHLPLALVEGERISADDIYDFHGVVMHSRYAEETYPFLNQMGAQEISEDQQFWHFKLSGRDQTLLLSKKSLTMGWLRAGTVHHIAWKAKDKEELSQLQKDLRTQNRRTSDLKDRKYFMSLYSREPGHILFEYATSVPGFLVDEEESDLGQTLQIPPHFKNDQSEILKQLPPLNI